MTNIELQFFLKDYADEMPVYLGTPTGHAELAVADEVHPEGDPSLRNNYLLLCPKELT